MQNIYYSNYFKQRLNSLSGRDRQLFKRDCSYANVLLENTEVYVEDEKIRIFLSPLAKELSGKEMNYYLIGALKIINSYLDFRAQELYPLDNDELKEVLFLKEQLPHMLWRCSNDENNG